MLGVLGAAWAAPVAFGERTLEIPAPGGFVPSAAEVPQFLEVSQGYLPPENRLVEIYVTPDDKAAFVEQRTPLLARYLQLQAARALEGKAISAAGFADARAVMESELEKVLGDAAETAGQLTTRGNDTLQDVTGSEATLSVGGVRYLGAFRREDWGLFFTLESDVTVSGSNIEGDVGGTVVSAGALVLANHQMLYLYAFANQADGARAWAQDAVSTWADAVRAANPDDPAVARAAVDLSGHTTLFRNVGMAVGAVAGVLVALAILALRRRKTA